LIYDDDDEDEKGEIGIGIFSIDPLIILSVMSRCTTCWHAN
jgi:hypothetical protein